MNRILDIYFKRPLFWDYFIASFLTIIVFYLVNYQCLLEIPSPESMFSVSSDLATIGLTCSGFLITLLTVLITFKSSANITSGMETNNKSVFDLFFASELYFETVNHFKNGIKSLLFISIVGYLLKIFLKAPEYNYLMYYNLPSLIVVVMTLWRSTLMLSQILKMQKEVVKQ